MFCEFCANNLANGEACNCDDAKLKRYNYEKEHSINHNKFCMFCAKALDNGELCNCQDAIDSRIKEGSKKPNSKVVMEEGSKQAKQIFEEIKNMFLTYKSDSGEYARNNALSIPAQVALFLLEAITFGFMIALFIGKAVKSTFGGGVVNVFKIGFQSSLVIVLNIAIVIACYYVVALIFMKKQNIKTLTSKLSITSTLWSFAFIIISISGIILSVEALTLVLVVVLLIVITATSLVINNFLNINPADSNRYIMIISISNALSICLTVIAIGAFTSQYISQLTRFY